MKQTSREEKPRVVQMAKNKKILKTKQENIGEEMERIITRQTGSEISKVIGTREIEEMMFLRPLR